MSTSDKAENVDPPAADGGKEKNGKSKQSSSSKSKDLSHVPCKFFKVGSCTAGASCPFSHNVLEAGASKDVCAWFVKGNCKFGHKCALAHVLPGQPMTMDKKNKKAAQAAAAAAGGKENGGKSSRGGRREGQGNAGGSGRNSLFAGSTAPTRVLGSNRSAMPMQLKASLSPSAPAPPLKDTEFAHFGLPEEDNMLDTAPAHAKRSSSVTEAAGTEGAETPPPASQASMVDEPAEATTPSASREGLPVNSSTRPGLSHQARPPNSDFGPIGSPSRSVTSGSSIPRVNGFSPGTSPYQGNNYPTSPFSAPGTQSVFISIGENNEQNDMRLRSGIATSLGAAQSTRVWNGENRPRGFSRNMGAEEAVVDEELEDFIPGSLTDLLTPEERIRRMSRSNSGQSPLLNAVPREPNLTSGTGENHTPSHRYSRSVPASSILGDLRSIWSNQPSLSPGPTNAALLQGSPADQSHMSGLAINGMSSSFKSGSAFGGRSFTENFSPENSLLSPSNASAAFLPGLHHQYFKNKALGGSTRPTSNTLFPPNNVPISGTQFQPSATLHTSHLHNTYGARANQGSGATPDNLLSPGRPIPTPSQALNAEGPGVPMGDLGTSPSTRALRSHAPGQSLPQGLAAGYSRIHALPPLPSPSGSGTSPAFGASISPAATTNWASLTATPGSPAAESKLAPATIPPPPGGTTANAALESMFSRLSYSAATSRAAPSGSGPTPVLSRNVSGGRPWQPTNAQSPLSGPVVTGDEDEVFSMDG